MSDVDIVLEVATRGVGEVYKLSNAMTQLNRAVAGTTNPMRNLDARSRALSRAVGSADSSLKNYAKSISDTIRNQTILSNESGRVRKEIAGLGKEYRLAEGASASFAAAGIRDLKNYEKTLRKVRMGALVNDLKSVAQEQKRLGKDAQFVGRSLIIGLTTPVLAFGRFGLQSLVAVDKEFVRLNKILEGIAPNLDAAAKKIGIDLSTATKEQRVQADKLVASYQRLDKAVTATSVKFGLSKSLAVGIAADFAQIGIQSADAIAAITELTAVTEKLGDMDITNAQKLVQSLYFQAKRSMMQSGESRGLSFEELELRSIQAATAQLNLFNMVENQTALAMKDLGDAFPEVAAAATTFGLSMTEAAGLLAPMKSAGMEVGASANAIKVSLQRIVAPTKQTKDLFAQLTEEYGNNFDLVKGSGLDAIQALIDAYDSLNKSAAGQEGVLLFFSQVFGKRQSTRMLLPIQQLSEFDAVLKNTGKSVDSADYRIQQLANNAIKSANKATDANLPLINSYRDIGIIARIATATAGQAVEGFSASVTNQQIDEAIKVRDAVAKGIKDASVQEGIDLIGQSATDAGKIAYIQLAGVKNAQEVANNELEAALASLQTVIQRLKNSFKMFATDVIQIIAPSLERLSEFATKLYSSWSNLEPATKKLISQFIVGFGALVAAIGPLIFAFGQVRLAIGSVGKVFFSFIPAMRHLSIETVASKDAMLRLTKPLTVMGDTVVNTSGKFSTFIATMASGGGPLSRFADKVGRLTGVLQKQTTANLALASSVKEVRNANAVTYAMSSGIFERSRGRQGKQTGFKALSSISDGTSILPQRPVLRKLTAAELSLPDADRIAHEADVARKAATAYTDKYRRTLKELLAGKPMPLAGGVSPRGMYRYPAGSTADDGTKVGGRILNFGKIKAQAEREAAAVAARVESMENAKGLARLRVYNAERADELKRSNKARFAQMLLQRDKEVQLIISQENEVRKLTNEMRRQMLAAKGITTKLGGVGTGTLTKERFFKGQKITEAQTEKIMAGGLSAQMLTGKLNIKRGIEGAKGLVPKAAQGAEKLSGKFLGGAQVASAVKGAVGFVKDPVSGIKNIGNAISTLGPKIANFGSSLLLAFKNPMSLIAKIGPLIAKLGLKFVALKAVVLGAGTGFLVFSGVGAAIAAVIAIVIILVKNWQQFSKAIAPGIKSFKEAWGLIVDGIKGAIQPILDFFSALTGGGESSSTAVKIIATAFNVLGEVVKFIAGIISFLFKSVIGQGVRQALKPLLALIRGVVSFVSGIISLFKGNFSKGFGQIVDGIGKMVVGLMGPFGGLFSFVIKGLSKLLGVFGKLPKFLGGGIFKSASEGLAKAASFIDNAREMKIAPSKVKKVKDVPLEVTRKTQEKIANSIGEGIDAGAKKGAAALAKRLAQYSKELKTELQTDIQDRIKGIMKDVVTTLTDTLKGQKEQSLKLYDDQLLKIEETVKAEERLTKTKEYENKKRELEEQRALNKLNNQRNYALAIYEGRIDDARQISLEGRKEEDEANKQIVELETSRGKELAEQKRSDLIDSIKTAREVASKYFDDMIEGFTKAANKITEFPPTTAEKFNEQLEKLRGAANEYGNKAGFNFSAGITGSLSTLGIDASTPLTSSLEAISNTISKNNPFGENGVWQTTIDASLEGMKQKYIGLTDTLNTAVGESSGKFKELFDVYKGYKELVAKSEGESASGVGTKAGATAGGGTGGTGAAGSGTTGVGPPGIVSPENMAKVVASNYRKADAQYVINSLKKAFEMFLKDPNSTSGYTYNQFLKKYPDLKKNKSQPVIRSLYDLGVKKEGYNGYKLYAKGGRVSFGEGGPTQGPVQQGIPATLHGGEYVVRNSAVKKYGWGMLQNINQGTYKPKPFQNGGMIDEYKKGGVVKKPKVKPIDKSKLNPFSDLNYKPKKEVKVQPLKKKKGIFGKIQDTIESGMNFGADLIDYSGKQLKTMTYDPLIKLQEATFNPLLKILKAPGSKNLKVATPGQAALSGFESGLGLFGGPAITSAINKIASFGVKGGIGPVQRLTNVISKKFGNTASSASNIAGKNAKVAMQLPKKSTTSLEVYRPSTVPTSRTIESVIAKDRWGETTQKLTAEFFDMGKEYLTFGLGPKYKSLFEMDKAILDIPLNPFAISGTSKTSPKASKVTNDWLDAHRGFLQQQAEKLGITGQNDLANHPEIKSRIVDALLYKGSRGDANAITEYNRLVGIGRALSKIDKKKFGGMLPEQSSKLTSAVTKGPFAKMQLEDLFLVHETQYPFKFDANGNALIYPTSKYQTTGDNVEFFRDTIHFALNHVVQGHNQREAVGKGGHILVAKLKDVLKANPGSLDNLYGIDTFLTPPPGLPITFPKGSFKTFTTQEDSYREGFEAMSSLLKPGRKLLRFEGGSDSLTDFNASQAITRMAQKLQTTSQMHFGHGTEQVTRMDRIAAAGPSPEELINFMLKLSPNARASFFARRSYFSDFSGLDKLKFKDDFFSGVKEQIKSTSVMFNGGLIPKFANGGLVSGFGSQGVPAILHGGEYVVNSKAVKNIGLSALQAMNDMRFNTPKAPSYAGPVQPQTTSSSNVNIYVDNFIGERQWFESMMKDYNINVGPQNQKNAGLQNRTISTYNGLNRGL